MSTSTSSDVEELLLHPAMAMRQEIDKMDFNIELPLVTSEQSPIKVPSFGHHVITHLGDIGEIYSL